MVYDIRIPPIFTPKKYMIDDINITMTPYCSWNKHAYIDPYKNGPGIKLDYRDMTKCLKEVRCITDCPGIFKIEYLDIYNVNAKILPMINHKMKNIRKILSIIHDMHAETKIRDQQVRGMYNYVKIHFPPQYEGVDTYEYKAYIPWGVAHKLSKGYSVLINFMNIIDLLNRKKTYYEYHLTRIEDLKDLLTSIVYNKNNNITPGNNNNNNSINNNINKNNNHSTNVVMTVIITEPSEIIKYKLFDTTGIKPTAPMIQQCIRLLISIARYTKECNDNSVPIHNQHSKIYSVMKDRNHWQKRDALNPYTGDTPEDIFNYIKKYWLIQKQCHSLADKYINDIKSFKNNCNQMSHTNGQHLQKNLSALGTMFLMRTKNLKILYTSMYIYIYDVFIIFVHIIIQCL